MGIMGTCGVCKSAIPFGVLKYDLNANLLCSKCSSDPSIKQYHPGYHCEFKGANCLSSPLSGRSDISYYHLEVSVTPHTFWGGSGIAKIVCEVCYNSILGISAKPLAKTGKQKCNCTVAKLMAQGCKDHA